MSAVDITNQTNLITTPQSEAAENVQHAQVFGIDPDTYKEHKDVLKPVVDQAEQPAIATPTVARSIATSEQHAAAVAPDAGAFSQIEDWFSDVRTRFQNQTGPAQRIKDLAWKQLTSDPSDPGATFTPDDAFELKVLQAEQGQNFGAQPSHLGYWSGTAVDLAGDLTNMVSRNKGTIAAATAISAAIGAGTGAPLGLPGVAAGAARGAATGVLAGLATAGLDEGYKAAAGQTYLALGQQKDAEGNPVTIDEGTKRALAHGVGVVSTAIQLGTDKLLLDKLPYVQRLLNPASAASYIMAPANAGLRNAILKIGSSAMTASLGTTAQTIAAQMAKGIGSTYKDGEVNFVNGIEGAANDLVTNKGGARDEALASAGTGAFAGGMLGVAHEGLGLALTEGARGVRDNLRSRGSSGIERDVTPTEPGRITATPNSDIVDIDESGNPVAPNPGQRAAEALHLQDVLDASSKVAQETKLQKLAPQLSNELREQIAKSGAIDHLWVDREGLDEFVGDDPEKRAAVWTVLQNGSGTDDASLNAPARIPISAVMDLHDKWPEFGEFVKLDPAAPDPRGAKAYVERYQAAQKKRAEIAKEMGQYDLTPEERAQDVEVPGPEISDEDLVKKLDTKEVAQAYLGRLDKNTEAEIAKPVADNTAAIAQSESQLRARIENSQMVDSRIAKAQADLDAHNEAEKSGMSKFQNLRDAKETSDAIKESLNTRIEAREKELAEVTAQIEENKNSKVRRLDGDENLQRKANGIQNSIDSMRERLSGKNVPISSEAQKIESDYRKRTLEHNLEFEKNTKAKREALVSETRNELENLKLGHGQPTPETRRQLEHIAAVRNRVQAMVEHLPDDKSRQAVLTRAMPPDEPSHDVANEADYMDEAQHTDKLLRGLVPDKELDGFTKRNIQAKRQVVDELNADHQAEYNRIVDIQQEMTTEARRQQAYEDSLNDRRVNLVEKFRTGGGDFSSTKNSQRAIYAIDPSTLTDQQRNQWLDDAALKEHGVFANYGGDAEQTARLLGVRDADTLFKILSETPSRDQLVANHLAESEAELRHEALISVEPDHAALESAYQEQTHNNLQAAQYLADASLKTNNKNVARFAGKLARPKELREQAENAIANMPSEELNANKYKVAARKSQRLAVKARIDDQLVEAAMYMQKAALNNELALASMKAIADTNAVKKYAKLSNSKEMVQQRKDAGRSFVKAHNALMDYYNLNPSAKNTAKPDDYVKWVKEMSESGQGDFSILPKYSDIREDIGKMTVGQIREAGRLMKANDTLAAQTNELLTAAKIAKELQTVEAVTSKMVEKLAAHPRYKKSRAETPIKEMSRTEKMDSFLSNAFESLRNMQHILRALDEGKPGGIFYSEIMARVKGEGVFAEYGQSNLNKREHEDAQYMTAAIERTLGKDRWLKMRNNNKYIPEFENNPKISPHQSEGTLFTALMNIGTVGNLDELANGHGVTKEVWQRVIERELTEKHGEMAQAIGDMTAKKFPDVVSRKKIMEGIEPGFVPRRQFTMWGRDWDGWFHTLRYENQLSLDEIARQSKTALDQASGQTTPTVKDSYDIDSLTKTGFDKDRVGGGGRPVSLDMDTIGQNNYRVNHALAYQMVLRDALKLLQDPQVAHHIAGVEGVRAYNQLLHNITELADPSSEGNALTDTVKHLDNYWGASNEAVISATLGWKVTVALKHTTNSVYFLKHVGPVNAAKALKFIAGKAIQHPTLIGDMYNLAAQINPELRDHLNGIERAARDQVTQLMPIRDSGKLRKARPALRKMQDVANAGSVKVLSGVDAFVKVLEVLTASVSFRSGNVEGFDRDTLNTMEKHDFDHRLRAYVNDAVGLSSQRKFAIDRTPIERAPYFKWATTFYGPMRNTVANTLYDLRTAKDYLGKAKDDVLAKDFSGARKNGTKVAKTVIGTMLAMTVLRMLEDWITDNKESPWNQEESSVANYASYVLLSMPTVLARMIPVVSDTMYGFESYMRAKEHGHVEAMTIGNFRTKILVDTALMTQAFIDEYNGNDLDRFERNAIVQAPFELAGIGVPTASILKGYDAIQQSDQMQAIKDSVTDRISKQIDALFKKQETAKPGEKLDEDVMNQLRELNEQMKQHDGAANDAPVPDGAIDKIKQIESGGNVFAHNPNSSAAGLYQFTAGTWDKIRAEAPDLGLTKAGRTLANGEQQEKAMQWFTQNNANKLQAANVQVDTTNLYAAHFLGAEKAIAVLQAKQGAKLADLIGSEAMSANGFKSSMKVGQFKKWLNERMASASSGETAMLDK